MPKPKRYAAHVDNIDLGLLKRQKLSLVTVLDSQILDNAFSKQTLENLEGILNLLDSIQDNIEGF
jgi:hypothetical protein